MGKMSKTIKKLEKDNILWKGKHEQASKNMFSMAEELNNQKLKSDRLEKLCRALQAENKSCREKLAAATDPGEEGENGEVETVTPPPPTENGEEEEEGIEVIPSPQEDEGEKESN
eukprot:sb/3476777/